MYTLNFLEFIAKNLFWYSIASLIFGSLDVSTWGIFDGFMNILSVIVFELILFGSCLTEINE
jgi:hypothetical protein